MSMLLGILEQGFIYSILALGVYITYKILDFPDLTVDSSFPLGAAICAILITKEVNPYLSLLLAVIAGGFAGLITGIIHVKFKVRDLLSGIITMTILYSINLHIATKANLPIFKKDNIFTFNIFEKLFLKEASIETISIFKQLNNLIVILIIAIIAKILLDLYLKTKSGFLLRAVGDNSTLVTTLAKDSGSVKIIGLVIANSLVSLAGGVMCQYQRFFEISMGTGAIVMGLASVIIGINLQKKISFINATTAVILGSIAYKACVAAAISLGLPAIDMKLITGLLFLAILAMGNFKKGGLK